MQKYSIPLSVKNSARIQAQAETWRKDKLSVRHTPGVAKHFITISRQFGCGAYPLAEMLADKIAQEIDGDPWAVYDRALVDRISSDHKLSKDLIVALSKDVRTEMDETWLGLLKSFTPELKVYRSMVSTIRLLAMHGNAIIVGRGSAILTRDMPGGLHVRLTAPTEWRIRNVMDVFKLAYQDAKDHLVKMDEERESFIRKYLNADITDPDNYHMILNNAILQSSEMAAAITSALKQTIKLESEFEVFG